MSRPTTPLPTTKTSINTTSSNFTSPSRSSTHPARPPSHRHHHIPHAPHRTHHRHTHDKSIPQSAIQAASASPFGDFLDRQSSKIDGTRTPTREARERDEQVREAKAREEGETEKAKWAKVDVLKEKRRAANDELRSSLSDLSTLSTSTTRCLDYTYYSLLSSLSTLRSDLASMHTLATSFSILSSHFTQASTSLSTETRQSIQSATANLDAQHQRITELEARMRDGRRRVNDLTLRLDAVKTRVEGVARADAARETSLGRRMKMLWGSMAMVLIVILALVVAKQNGVGVDVRGEDTMEVGEKGMFEKEVEALRNESAKRKLGRIKRNGTETWSSERERDERRVDMDRLWRRFDEL